MTACTRNLLTLATALVISFQLSAQTNTEKVADSACTCLKENKDKIKSGADFEKFAQECLLKFIFRNAETLALEENVKLEEIDKEAGETLGRAVGIKLAGRCPLFLELYSAYGNDDKPSANSISGTVTGVEVREFVYITIRGADGKTSKLVMLRYVDGADAFKASPIKLKGKKITAEWQSADVYSVGQKNFITVKEITAMELK